jgi:hypothetical protein
VSAFILGIFGFEDLFAVGDDVPDLVGYLVYGFRGVDYFYATALALAYRQHIFVAGADGALEFGVFVDFVFMAAAVYAFHGYVGVYVEID